MNPLGGLYSIGKLP